MKKVVVLAIFLSVLFNGISTRIINTAECRAEEGDAFLAILALNYCHFSLYKIIEYNDRIVLDEEYDIIINNINLTKINDPELIVILKELMDVLTQFKLDERSKEKLLRQYEKNVEGALYSAMGDAAKGTFEKRDQINTIASTDLLKRIASQASQTALAGGSTAVASGPGAPVVAAATCAVILAQAGSAYVSYRNAIEEYRTALDEAVWKLEGDAIERINEINKKFLETYWQLMKKYNAPDKWRLTLDQFKDYLSILKDKDDGRKYRNLLRMEGDLNPFPPYWYYRGSAAQAVGKTDDVLNCYEMYKQTRRGFFRQDKTYSSAIMLKVVESNYIENHKALLDDLNEMVELDKKDWRKRLLSAYKLIQYGYLVKAKEQIQVNIDNDSAVSVSRKALAEIYCIENDKEHLSALIEKAMQDDKATSLEVLYLIGKLPASEMIAKIKDQILGITPEIKTSIIGKDALLFRMPYRWILDEPKNLKMKLTVNEEDFEPKNVTAEEGSKEIVFMFEDVLDAKKLLEAKGRLPLGFSLKPKMVLFVFYPKYDQRQ